MNLPSRIVKAHSQANSRSICISPCALILPLRSSHLHAVRSRELSGILDAPFSSRTEKIDLKTPKMIIASWHEDTECTHLALEQLLLDLDGNFEHTVLHPIVASWIRLLRA